MATQPLSSTAGAAGIFSTDRFKLALVDQLLDEPLIFALDKPVITVGFEKGDCIIPTIRMGLEKYAPFVSSKAKKMDLLTLSFDLSTSKWMIKHKGLGHDKFLRTMESLKWGRSPAERGDSPTYVTAGVIFTVPIPSGIWGDPGPWGSLSFKLVDTTKGENGATDVDGAAGFEKTRLAVLPERALSIIAGLLPLGTLDSLCLAEPYIVSALVGSVEWKEMSFFSPRYGTDTVLGALRRLRLLSQDNIEQLTILRGGIVPDQKADALLEGARQLLLAEIVHLFTGERLKVLSVTNDELDLIPRNDAVKFVIVDARTPVNDETTAVWYKIAKLDLSPTAEIRLKFIHENALAFPYVCNAKEVRLTKPLANVTEVCWHCCDLCVVPPLGNLPRLKYLRITCAEADEYYEKLVIALSTARLPDLEILALNACVRRMGPLLRAFGKAAPFVKDLRWGAEGWCKGGCRIYEALEAVDAIKPLGNLKKFSLDNGGYVEHVGRAVQLFTELKHLQSVIIRKVLTSESEEVFTRKFDSLRDAGKMVKTDERWIRGHRFGASRKSREPGMNAYDVLVCNPEADPGNDW